MATIDAQDLRRIISRFRVLIVVRANTGKTTILQKVCNTTDDPEICDSNGKKIDAAIVKSSIKRGNHDITNEMVFKSDPGLVSHDSCGFEAGSEEEFENMKRFILQPAHNEMRGANPCYLVLYSNGRPKSNIPAVGREVLLGVRHWACFCGRGFHQVRSSASVRVWRHQEATTRGIRRRMFKEDCPAL